MKNESGKIETVGTGSGDVRDVRCPMCHGCDEFCLLCDGSFVVEISCASEFHRQNPDAR